MPNITKLDPSNWKGARLFYTSWPYPLPDPETNWVDRSSIGLHHPEFTCVAVYYPDQIQKLVRCPTRLSIYVDEDGTIWDVEKNK